MLPNLINLYKKAQKKGKKTTSRRYNLLPLGIGRELAV